MKNNPKTVVLLLGALFALFSGVQGQDLVRMKVADGISVKLPQTFVPMGELDLTQRYPSVRHPVAAFTSPDREVDFNISISATRWPDANLELAGQFFKASLFNLFTDVEVIEEGVREVNGTKMAFVEFESRISGDPSQLGMQDPVLRYSQILYYITPAETLVISFHCPRRLRPQWESVADEIMGSLRIRR